MLRRQVTRVPPPVLIPIIRYESLLSDRVYPVYHYGSGKTDCVVLAGRHEHEVPWSNVGVQDATLIIQILDAFRNAPSCLDHSLLNPIRWILMNDEIIQRQTRTATHNQHMCDGVRRVVPHRS